MSFIFYRQALCYVTTKFFKKIIFIQTSTAV